MAENTLYFGDNLKILRDNIRDETVDLIYVDPPFNSKANYNVLFRSPKGHESHAQITATPMRGKSKTCRASAWQSRRTDEPSMLLPLFSSGQHCCFGL